MNVAFTLDEEDEQAPETSGQEIRLDEEIRGGTAESVGTRTSDVEGLTKQGRVKSQHQETERPATGRGNHKDSPRREICPEDTSHPASAEPHNLTAAELLSTKSGGNKFEEPPETTGHSQPPAMPKDSSTAEVTKKDEEKHAELPNIESVEPAIDRGVAKSQTMGESGLKDPDTGQDQDTGGEARKTHGGARGNSDFQVLDEHDATTEPKKKHRRKHKDDRAKERKRREKRKEEVEAKAYTVSSDDVSTTKTENSDSGNTGSVDHQDPKDVGSPAQAQQLA